VQLVSLAISDFRNISEAEITPVPDQTTVISGLNGAGKTSVLEAVAYLATLQSFRGSPRETLVRRGASRAILRAQTVVEGRTFTIEAEIPVEGRARILVNRQVVHRRRELSPALRTTVFSPEDIGVVRSGPSDRREFLDGTLAVVDPKSARHADDTEKILRQRGALLRNSGRRPSPEVLATLDVWDSRLDDAGTALVESREALVLQLAPIAEAHYRRLAGRDASVGLDYRRSWTGRLLDALMVSRDRDLERGVSLVGPHRDELELTLDGLPGRTHTSQGEQRSLALALRLAAHQLATERLGVPPVLLLDDVFSELDPFRARALLTGLPAGQALLTTAVPPPEEVLPARTYRMESGGVAPGSTAELPGVPRDDGLG